MAARKTNIETNLLGRRAQITMTYPPDFDLEKVARFIPDSTYPGWVNIGQFGEICAVFQNKDKKLSVLLNLEGGELVELEAQYIRLTE